MNSVKESKNELEASIRYAENAISSAKATIESMEFRQQMAQKQYAEQTGREEALQREVAELKLQLEGCKTNMALMTDELEKPTMPVIPKDVAIAIFREGVRQGVEAACTELEGSEVRIEESEYVGDFEVSFSRRIDLDDELDLDWMRGKVGDYDEASVVEALKGLCADKEFECRIYGIDDKEEKKND
jgi:hypothetical protein